MPGDSCLRNANIVVADDDRITRNYISKLLRNQGARVVSVAGGESAIQAVRKGDVDLVVLDELVNGLNAMETSRAIGSVSRAGFIPIFLLTRRGKSGARIEGTRIRADEHIAKPFEDAEFLARVRAMLHSKHAAHEEQEGGAPLPDQRYFRSRVEKELERAERCLAPFACCMLAVDDFRDLIRELGATGGDESLRALSELLRRNVRDTDLVTRFRTAEFGLLLPNTSLAGALTLCDRIVGKMHREGIELGNGRRPRVSLGIGTYPDARIRTADQLIDAAGLAVEQARSVGPNHICCLQQPGYVFRPKLSSQL